MQKPPYSGRHQQNRYYAFGLFQVFSVEQMKGEYAWLFEGLNTPRWKRLTVLAELGRLAASKHSMTAMITFAVARELCRAKPPTDRALAYVRAWRRQMAGKATPADEMLLVHDL